MIYPWQEQQWQAISRLISRGRLPHALLFSGSSGLGKLDFAHQLAASFFCKADTTLAPCGICAPCHWVAQKTHPSIHWVIPESDDAVIKVDQIRAACDFMLQSSLQGNNRVCVIYPAEQMNLNAANALLKTLEEPPAGAFYLLISHQAGRLAATIRSRCYALHFSPPPKEQALAWFTHQHPEVTQSELLLELAHGAPLGALNLHKTNYLHWRTLFFSQLKALLSSQADPIQAAAAMNELEVLNFLDLNISLVMDLMRLHLGDACTILVNEDQKAILHQIYAYFPLSQCLAFLDQLKKQRAQFSQGIHLNKSLVFEQHFLNLLTS